MKISVIVPTYKRPDSLPRTLGSLQFQMFEDFEILVVDNGADPAVARQVEAYSQVEGKSNGGLFHVSHANKASGKNRRVRMQYLSESRLGLHHARHAGVRAASGDILVFTDDDATFEPGWLAAYAEAFAEHPEMVAAGGPVLPVWEQPPPQWLLDYVVDKKRFGPLSIMEPHHEFRLPMEGSFFGVNMACRNQVFQSLGFHPELVGRRTIGDGEAGLNEDIVKSGGLIGYVPEAVVYHHVPSERQTLAHIRKWAWHLGGGQMYMRWRNRKRGLRALAREVVKIVREYRFEWFKDFLVRHRQDPEAIDIQFQANLGWSKLNYIWWMITDTTVKAALDLSDFRP
jgi:glycosyltransferase involved in cell wall biosynthesis